jgi:hypothetical protein
MAASASWVRRTLVLFACAAACGGLVACDLTVESPDDENDKRDSGVEGEYDYERPLKPKPGGGDDDDGVDEGDPPYPDAGMMQDGGAMPGDPNRPRSALPGRGSAIALAEDDSVAVVVNRDVGSVTVLELVDSSGSSGPELRFKSEVLLGEGSEPWQVAIDAGGDTAYVVLRKDQRLVRISKLKTAPALDGYVAVGSEPTAVALSASGARAFVANWSDGTVSEIDTEHMELVRSFDLNAALVATGYLGDVQPRPALAHPRSLAVTNDLDQDDGDEALYVTEYHAQQIEAEAADGSNSDTRKVGLVYKVALATGHVSTIDLGALEDIGFRDERNGLAGCYPNQLQAIALNGPFAYVVSVCASPEGPIGVKVTSTACTAVGDCAPLNLVEPVCAVPAAGAAAVCVDVASVKTTTAPVLSIIDTRIDREVPSSASSLNARFAALYAQQKTAVAAQRFPLFANDIAFVPGTAVAYVTAGGIDAVFRIETDGDTGAVHAVGSSTQLFIDLVPAGIGAKAGRSPVGIAIGHVNKKRAIVANDVTRNASLLDFNTQTVAGGASDAKVVQTAALPPAGSDGEDILQGKRFFNTGGGRWSLRAQGWGACQSCHSDGLTDNVTWFFARGPRQSTSLDGSLASTHPEDQRIFNWTAIFDEVDDFELNTRGVSGGVGAIVSALSVPPQTADRIDIAKLGHAALNGSARDAGDPDNPLGLDPSPKLPDWKQIERYMQTIRSPRGPSNLDAAKVAAGRQLFTHAGSCVGCHSGEKWTISRMFYTPAVKTNADLLLTSFAIPSGFPSALLPAQVPANQTLRFNGGNAAALDQIQCAIRPVGSFNVAEPGVGIAELRADMSTVAQGDGNPLGEGRGYNPPSLLGVVTGAPYMHAGNARTLEALLASTFETHHRALAPNFLAETDPYVVQQQVDDLVQFLLSIDETTEYPAIPTPGAGGGQLCPTSFP